MIVTEQKNNFFHLNILGQTSGRGNASKLRSKVGRQVFDCYLYPVTLKKFLALLSHTKE